MEQQNVFFKARLMSTGPTPVPEFVHSAMSRSVYYHRGPAFAELMGDCRRRLPKVVGTAGEVLIMNGTGTLAMEGAIANFFNSGDKVIAINSGKFGARWATQARIYGCEVDEIMVERGRAVELEKVADALKKNPDTKGLLIHASETSTGVRHDIKALARMASEAADCLSLVDAVTAMGVFQVPMDKWGIDVFVGGAQKGMMLPPGICFGAASSRAWQRAKECQNVRYYMDWRKELKAAQDNSGAFTSAVTLVGGLQSVLEYFEKVGLENIYKRNWKLAFATRAAATAMGFELLVKDENAVSPVCTPVIAEGPYAREIRDRFSLTMSGGQDELKGKIIRLGHLGYIDGWDVLSQLMAIGQVGRELGRTMNIEAGFETFWQAANSKDDATPENMKVSQ